MKKIITLLFIITFNFCVADNQIVAVVDKEIITKTDLDERLKATLETNPEASKMSKAELFSDVLNSMINEKVFLQEAERVGIKPSKKEVSQVVRNIEISKGMSKGDFLKDLESKGLSKDAFLEQVKTNITWESLLSEVIAPKIEVSNEELLNFISNSQPDKVRVDAYIASVNSGDKSGYYALEGLKKKTKSCSYLEHLQDKEIYISKVSSALSAVTDIRTRKAISDMQKGQISEIYDDQGKSKFVVVCNKRYDMNTSEMSSFDNILRQQKINVQAEYYMQNLKKKKFIEIYDF